MGKEEAFALRLAREDFYNLVAIVTCELQEAAGGYKEHEVSCERILEALKEAGSLA